MATSSGSSVKPPWKPNLTYLASRLSACSACRTDAGTLSCGTAAVPAAVLVIVTTLAKRTPGSPVGDDLTSTVEPTGRLFGLVVLLSMVKSLNWLSSVLIRSVVRVSDVTVPVVVCCASCACADIVTNKLMSKTLTAQTRPAWDEGLQTTRLLRIRRSSKWLN